MNVAALVADSLHHQEVVDYHALPGAMSAFLVERGDEGRKSGATRRMPPRHELEARFLECGRNAAALARAMGEHRTQVNRWLKAYGLK